MRRYAIAVARCRRGRETYEERLSRLIERMAVAVGGETYPLVENIIGLVERKRQLAAVAETDRLMSAELTPEENEALTICTCGEGSRRAAERLGVDRLTIIGAARRALDKCSAVLRTLSFSCREFVDEVYSAMLSDIKMQNAQCRMQNIG